MSYNITTCKIKELTDLKIPVESLYTHERTDWHPDQPKIIDLKTMKAQFDCGCEQSIIGTIDNGIITVEKLNLSGEGSGTLMNWIIKPALEKSTGKLVAKLIWEGGDSISELTVIDGVITDNEIEL